MSPRGPVVRVWPSRAAQEQGLTRALQKLPGGFLAEPAYFTWDNLLPSVLEQIPLRAGQGFLLPLAGPLLVQQLLREKLADEGWALFHGQASGRRLPHRLWRLLVEAKAANLSPQALAGLPGPRIKALGNLLAAYQARLDELGILDQADGLAILEQLINTNKIPGELKGWAGLEARDVLWLRAMDIRLLRALGQVMPVKLEFALSAPARDPKGVFNLLNRTAQVLESDPRERIQALWRDRSGFALAGLIEGMLAGASLPRRLAGIPDLELVLAAGRYGEVEHLLGRAAELLEQGIPAGEVVLAFPSLEVYAQMCGDVAGRMGLPLEQSEGRSLLSSPLAAWFISLLELPLNHFPRSQLARVLDSPFMAPFLGGSGGNNEIATYRPESINNDLKKLGYIDSRESSLGGLARKFGAKLSGKAGFWQKITVVTTKLEQLINTLPDQCNLTSYIQLAGGILDQLAPERSFWSGFQRENAASELKNLQAQAQVAGLLSLRELRLALGELEQAASQVELTESLSRSRSLAVLKEALSLKREPRGHTPLGGLKVLSLEQAAGIRARHVLVGGLAQGEFPRRPRGGELLGSQDRLSLGRRASFPVWRTDEEEYGGQMMRLALLLGQAGDSLTMSSPRSGSDGSPKETIHIIKYLSDYLSIEIKKLPGGSFGGPALLNQRGDPQALWAGLSRSLLQAPCPADQENRDLSQAVLHAVWQDQSLQDTWLDIYQRINEEKARLSLDLLAPEQRGILCGPFSGRFSHPAALRTLGLTLAEPARRRLSPSSLESLARCPAAWFWTRLLGLRAVPVPELDLERKTEGDWVHAALRIFFQPEKYLETPPPDLETLVGRCLDQAREQLLATGSATHRQAWDARREVLLASLTKLAQREYEAMGDLRPWATERDFGGEHNEFIMQLLERPGESLELVGRVDRIDLGEGKLRVTDYKHSSNGPLLQRMARKQEQGKSAFQLPVYLAAARLLAGEAGGERQLSARILPTILLSLKTQTLAVQEDDLFLALSPERRSQAKEQGEVNLFNAIEDIWLDVLSGDFSPRPQAENCRLCEVSQVCRARILPGAGFFVEDDS